MLGAGPGKISWDAAKRVEHQGLGATAELGCFRVARSGDDFSERRIMALQIWAEQDGSLSCSIFLVWGGHDWGTESFG